MKSEKYQATKRVKGRTRRRMWQRRNGKQRKGEMEKPMTQKNRIKHEEMDLKGIIRMR